MAIYSTYQLKSSQVDWNEELEGINKFLGKNTKDSKVRFDKTQTSTMHLLKS